MVKLHVVQIVVEELFKSLLPSLFSYEGTNCYSIDRGPQAAVSSRLLHWHKPKARVRSVTAACQFAEEVGGSKRSSRASTIEGNFGPRVPQECTGRVPAPGTSFW